MLYLGDFGDGGGERLGEELAAELQRRVVVVAGANGHSVGGAVCMGAHRRVSEHFIAVKSVSA